MPDYADVNAANRRAPVEALPGAGPTPPPPGTSWHVVSGPAYVAAVVGWDGKPMLLWQPANWQPVEPQPAPQPPSIPPAGGPAFYQSAGEAAPVRRAVDTTAALATPPSPTYSELEEARDAIHDVLNELTAGGDANQPGAATGLGCLPGDPMQADAPVDGDEIFSAIIGLPEPLAFPFASTSTLGAGRRTIATSSDANQHARLTTETIRSIETLFSTRDVEMGRVYRLECIFTEA